MNQHEQYGPWAQYAGIVTRTDRRIDLQIRNDPNVVSYHIWGALNVDDMYGDPAGSGVGGDPTKRKLLFTVKQGTTYQSPSIVRRKAGYMDENIKGTTRAIFDLTDFITPGMPPILPPANGQFVLAVQQVRAGGPSVVPATQAVGTVEILGGLAAADTFTLKGVVFTAVNPGPAVAANQEFLDVAASGGTIATATSLVAAINHAASQALLSAQAVVGVVASASNGGTAIVTIRGSVVGDEGELAMAENTAGANMTLSDVALVRLANEDLPVLGSLLIVPEVTSYGLCVATILVSGTAPDIDTTLPPFAFDTSLSTSGPPLCIVLPRPTTSVNIRNLDGGDPLFFSFGWSQPYAELPQGSDVSIFGSVKEIFIAGDGGNPRYTIAANTNFSTHGST